MRTKFTGDTEPGSRSVRYVAIDERGTILADEDSPEAAEQRAHDMDIGRDTFLMTETREIVYRIPESEDPEPEVMTDGGEDTMSVFDRTRERLADTSEDFDIQKGDEVIVRAREHGTSGNIRAKIHGQVLGFHITPGPLSDTVSITAPWDDTVHLQKNDAEYEVKDD